MDTGWLKFGPGETVRCPSPFTFRRDDRRAGARVQVAAGADRGPEFPPPLAERRRLLWPANSGYHGQRTCHRIVGEVGPQSVAWIRVCPISAEPNARYLPETPPAGTGCVLLRLCPDCGVMAELWTTAIARTA